jgi:F-type H+-transporting ATPase subunit a
MALDLLTGLAQAYIFAVLAMVFITSAVEDGARTPPNIDHAPSPTKKDS